VDRPRTHVVDGLADVVQRVGPDQGVQRESPLAVQVENAGHEHRGGLVADDGAGHGSSFQQCEGVGSQVRSRGDTQDRRAAERGQCGHGLRHHVGYAGAFHAELDARSAGEFPCLLDGGAAGGVDDVGRAEPGGQVEPRGLHVTDDDPGGAGHHCRHDRAQAHGTGAEDGDRAAGRDPQHVPHRTGAGEHTTAQRREHGVGCGGVGDPDQAAGPAEPVAGE